MSEIELYEYDTARMVAEGVQSKIRKFCRNVEIVGGLRRELAQVHDIDLVAQPEDHFTMSIELGNGYKHVLSSKTKHSFKVLGINVEIWLASNDRQFEVLKLLRTGSAGFMKMLCQTAIEKNMSFRYSYKEGLCGLYGAAKAWTKDDKTGQHHQKTYVNPARKIAYKEDEIIMTVMDNEDYLNPRNRSLGFEEDIDSEI
jgi:hypothetical protein